MFEKVRHPGHAKSQIKNWTAYLLFGAIVLVFVFFGVGPGQFSGLLGGGSAAIVNNQVISLADYRQAVRQMENQFKMQLDQLPAPQRKSINQNLRNRALENLITLEASYQEASKEGILTSEAAVRDEIIKIPVFQEEGRFRRERYDQYLAAVRTSSRLFEEKVKRQLVLSRMQSLMSQALQPTKVEWVKEEQVKNSKINLRFIKFKQKDLESKIKLSKQKIKEFSQDKGSEEALNKYFEANKKDYSVPEQVKARHILIKFESGNEESEKKALARIQELEKKAKKEDFAELAQKHSEDLGSKVKKGDLGYFGKGRMVPEFEKVAFSLPPGQISGPVKTSYGYHLIMVEDKKPGGEKTLDEVRLEVAEKVLKQEGAQSAKKKLEDAVQKADLKEVEKWAKNLGLKWEETGDFDLSRSFIPKVGDNESIFEGVSLAKGEGALIPKPIQSRGEEYIFQIKTLHLMDSAQPLPKEEDKMADRWASRSANEALEQWMETAKSSAKVRRNKQL